MLHAIDSTGWTKNTAWCVPSAISFLTGIPLIHSHSRAAMIQDIKLKDVKGIYGAEAAMLLREQGYIARPIDLTKEYSKAPKLNKFISDRTAYQKCVPMMIQVESAPDFAHMVVSHYGYMADNWTMKPVEMKKFPHKARYVTNAWVVEKKNNIQD